MAHVYEVKSNKGTHKVEVDQHHDQISKADFERALIAALFTLGSGIILHHYSYLGRR